MPCAVTHLVLADRLLDAWHRSPHAAPIEVRSAPVRKAFLHGALAPDMGFLPGVDRFVSELAHYQAPAELARQLLAGARTPEDEGFAWGWASHVVVDVALHPLIGRVVGERRFGDRSIRVNAIDDLSAHVGAEVGLDIFLLASVPSIPMPPRAPHFDEVRIAHLAEALGAAYGIAWDGEQLLRDHRRAVTLTRWWPKVLTRIAGNPLLAWSAALVNAASNAGSAASGLLRPSPPPTWLADAVERLAGTFPAYFHEEVGEGLNELQNRNLETGEESGPGHGHPPSDAVAVRLSDARVRTRRFRPDGVRPRRSNRACGAA